MNAKLRFFITFLTVCECVIKVLFCLVQLIMGVLFLIPMTFNKLLYNEMIVILRKNIEDYE